MHAIPVTRAPQSSRRIRLLGNAHRLTSSSGSNLRLTNRPSSNVMGVTRGRSPETVFEPSRFSTTEADR
jgi:hypothetical protein